MLCAAFLLALVPSLAAMSYVGQRSAAHELLQARATLVASVLADDGYLTNAGAARALNLLEREKHIAYACVRDSNGAERSVLASDPKLEVSCGALGHTTLPSEYMLATADIVRSSTARTEGEIVLIGYAPELMQDTGRWALLALGMVILLGLMGWALGLRLQHAFIKPIRQIASTAQRVSLYKDYSLRVVSGALDVLPEEVRSLTDSFNSMLKEIEDRDSRLSRKSAELERARQAAESASQAKSQFLANVSHELRTPLNAIIGFSKMLAEQQFGPLGDVKYVEYSKDIQDSGKHLLDVINDILDLTRAETGKLSVAYSALQAQKVIEKALRIVSGQAYQRKLDIYTDIPEKLPKLIADPVRVVQILLNLLSNAIKFSHEGGKITIRVRAETARQGVHYFTIEVIDTGIGMTDAQINKAFSTFNQADAGLNRKYEGAGLGLPLTKRLVELHHGKIKIESKLGEGTTVTVRLTSDPALLD